VSKREIAIKDIRFQVEAIEAYLAQIERALELLERAEE